MSQINWETFVVLPGSVTHNFEMLCRGLIRRHYAQYGIFRSLANQPGVEFHLKFTKDCILCDKNRWYGWQCKWYDLPSGKDIGSARRAQIIDAIKVTETKLPGITDWVLWTRHALTKKDQEWFDKIKTKFQMHLWTGSEIEEHLNGPGEMLRAAYFGELIITSTILDELHQKSIATIKNRWMPDVHQSIDAERYISSILLNTKSWEKLEKQLQQLDCDCQVAIDQIYSLPQSVKYKLYDFIDHAFTLSNSAYDMYSMLKKCDVDHLKQQATELIAKFKYDETLLSNLRANRLIIALSITNVIASLDSILRILLDLGNVIDKQMVAIVADAGCGKTHLAAKITLDAHGKSRGILLFGANLHVDHNIDIFSNNVSFHGKQVQTFEALVEAIDALGARTGKRIPIVIDGLNEAEDPRKWKTALSSVPQLLHKYPYVVVICTLRPDFVKESLPDDELLIIQINGFDHDFDDALKRYFSYYKIKPTDAYLPHRLLHHPLTLRLFCEVTNPDRNDTVGVASIPSSLTSLFELYLDQVAEKISKLSPSCCRFYASDVRTALNQLGLLLWQHRTRSIDIRVLRETLSDDKRPWDKSLARALEQEGILLKASSNQFGSYNIMILYDLLAGHIVADAILSLHSIHEFKDWWHDSNVSSNFLSKHQECHPLHRDIFKGLVGLFPCRFFRRQFWEILDEPLRTDAIYHSTYLDPKYIDADTVHEIELLILKQTNGYSNILFRLLSLRAAINHPLNVDFIDGILSKLTIADRDLYWTEWIRTHKDEIINDLERIEEITKSSDSVDIEDIFRAKWIKWTLTSTVRPLRDQATRTLYWLGRKNPEALFQATIESFEINDPYIPERMLAACYGTMMALWSVSNATLMRDALTSFVNRLIIISLSPSAPYSTTHSLINDYLIGIVQLSNHISPDIITTENKFILTSPLIHLTSPFKSLDSIAENISSEVKDAIHMDFGNYTLGRLIPDRGNYNFEHTEYRNVRTQIECRIKELGYSSDRFNQVDKQIMQDNWHGRGSDPSKTDRYGKKYSWIAYFEMYGLRQINQTLPDWRLNERSSDVDIDPSFPENPREWSPPLPELFSAPLLNPRAWIEDGPSPNYSPLLSFDSICKIEGPWVLLDGFIEQSAALDHRDIFTFLRGILIDLKNVNKIRKIFMTRQYPGNSSIPEPLEDHYTFFGEIPWSSRYMNSLRRKTRVYRDIRTAFGYNTYDGLKVEIPVCEYSWESYHSLLNKVGGIKVPSPSLCKALGLTGRRGELDLYDKSDQIATCFTKFKADANSTISNLFYMRADLLKRYLNMTKQSLLWLQWGERSFNYQVQDETIKLCQDLYSTYRHIHRSFLKWEPEPD